MPVSHGTERSDARSSQDAAERLVKWLNSDSRDPARTRIRHLVENIRHFYEAVELAEREATSDEVKLPSTYGKALRNINRQLRRYKFHPALMPLLHLPFWKPFRKKVVAFRGRWGFPEESGEDYSEDQAVYDLTSIMEGGFSRIARCVCGKWLYLKFSHQKFCSVKCREKTFRSSPEWKRYRRDKARKYYWLHKHKNTK